MTSTREKRKGLAPRSNGEESSVLDSNGKEAQELGIVDVAESNFSVLPPSLRRNFGILKKRKVCEKEATRIAEETQAMIRTEVRRMRNAVHELEAYLHHVDSLARRAVDEVVFDEHIEPGIRGDRVSAAVVGESDDEDESIGKGVDSSVEKTHPFARIDALNMILSTVETKAEVAGR